MTTDGAAAANTQFISDAHSYIARHWRGELSLARSCWLNGVLMVGVGGFGVFYLLPYFLAVAVFGLRFSMLEWIWTVSFLAWFGTYLWVWGGIWRAAGRYRGPRIWPLAARSAVVVAFAASLPLILGAFLFALGGLA